MTSIISRISGWSVLSWILAFAVHGIVILVIVTSIRPELYGVSGFNFGVALKIFVAAVATAGLVFMPLLRLLIRIYKPNFFGYCGVGVLAGIIISTIFLIAHTVFGLFTVVSLEAEIEWIFMFSMMGAGYFWVMLNIT